MPVFAYHTMVQNWPLNHYSPVLLKGYYFCNIFILSFQATGGKKPTAREGLLIWESIYRGFYICINKSLWGKPLISFVAAVRMWGRAFSVSCLKCFCTLFCGWSSKRCGNESAGEASIPASGLSNWLLPGSLATCQWWLGGGWIFSHQSAAQGLGSTWLRAIPKRSKIRNFKKTVKCECSAKRPHIFKELAPESPRTQLPQEAFLPGRTQPSASMHAVSTRQPHLPGDLAS